jgi:glucan phosphoethanolaminetransferase (alkaline phosphatase superfamily)
MIKFIQKQLDISLIKTSMMFALIYMLMFNMSVILYKYGYYKASFFSAIFELLKQFIYAYIAAFVFFFGLSIHRVLFIVGSIFLFLTGAIASYYLFYLGIAPTGKMMPAIYGSQMSEISELVSTRISIWIIFSLSICIFGIKHFNPQTTKSFFLKILMAVCLFLAINNIISPQFKVLKTYFPIQYLHNSYVYFFGNKDYVRQDISKIFNFKIKNEADDITAVLIIGESARYSNFGINGYERNTTPNIEKIGNLFSFQGHSCENITHLSVACLLSRHNEADLDKAKSETGLLSVLTNLGYNTTWVSTQSIMKYYTQNESTIYDEVNFSLIPGGSVLYAMNAHDELMLPYIEKLIEQEGKNFITAQLSGSHWNYASRYPEEFTKFTPVQKKNAKIDQSSCSREELINSYDNSILYTDFFLASVIKLLQNKNAFLIFVSDHAESLGEDGRLGHGAEFAPEQRDIPFMIWFSDSFKQNYPDLVDSVNSYKGQIISHDYVFHSVLDCLGIESNILEKNYSLCSPKKTKNNIIL